jgi:hypothetical protein
MNLTTKQILLFTLLIILIYLIYTEYKRENIAAYTQIDLCNKNNDKSSLFDSLKDTCIVKVPPTRTTDNYSFISKVHTPVLVDIVTPVPTNLNKPILTDVISSIPKNLKSVATNTIIKKDINKVSAEIKPTPIKQIKSILKKPQNINDKKLFISELKDIV